MLSVAEVTTATSKDPDPRLLLENLFFIQNDEVIGFSGL